METNNHQQMDDKENKIEPANKPGIIWIVIGFHFIQKTYFCLRDRRTDPGSSVV